MGEISLQSGGRIGVFPKFRIRGAMLKFVDSVYFARDVKDTPVRFPAVIVSR